jgi:hypothetical protein
VAADEVLLLQSALRDEAAISRFYGGIHYRSDIEGRPITEMLILADLV